MAFQDHGVTELVRMIAVLGDFRRHSTEYGIIGESSKKLEMALARRVHACQDRIDDTQRGCVADASMCNPIPGSDMSAGFDRGLKGADHRRPDRDDAAAGCFDPCDRFRGSLWNTIGLVERQAQVQRGIASR